MVLIKETIEIVASPETVRAVFLDFANVPKWNTVFKSIEIPSGKPSAELQDGDKIKVTINGMGTFPGVLLTNTPSRYSWRGSLPYIFTGDHSFQFEPSSITPGCTTFTNSESFSGLFAFTMSGWMPTSRSTQQGFARFCQELKRRVETGE